MSNAFKKKWLFNLYILVYSLVAIVAILFLTFEIPTNNLWIFMPVFMLVSLIFWIPLGMLIKKRGVYEDKYEHEKETKKRERVSEITRKLIAKRDQSKSETKIII
mgnify:CR=1 FL=1